MTNIPSPAEELRLLDLELRQLDARRSQLLARRAWLLGALRAAAPSPPRQESARRPETSRLGVQNALLLLGGLLLIVAAVAFTVVSWGRMGITGRALILGVITLAALAAPAVLLRRGLRSTAETVAGLALTLTVLDAYAVHRVALPDAPGAGFAAAACATLAALWTVYGLVLPTLRLPLPAAVAAAQLPLLLWAVAADAGPHTSTAALLGTAAFDVVLALRVGGGVARAGDAATGAGGSEAPAAARAGHAATATSGSEPGASTTTSGSEPGAAVAGGSEAPGGAAGTAVRTGGVAARVVATVGACGMAAWGVLAASRLSWEATSAGAAVRAGALLALAALIAGAPAWRVPRREVSLAAALASGLLAVAAAGGVLRTVVPPGWAVLGYLACGVALLTATRAPLSWPGRLPGATFSSPAQHGLACAAAAVHALAVLWTLPVVGATLLGPTSQAGSIWTGTPPNARAALPVFPTPTNPLLTSLVLAAVAAAVLATLRLTESAGASGRAEAGERSASTTASGRTEAEGRTKPSTPQGRADARAQAGPATPPDRTGSRAQADPGTSQPAPADRAAPIAARPAAFTRQHLWRPTARSLAMALAWAAVLVLPPALELPYAVGVAMHVALAAVLLGLAVHAGSVAVRLSAAALAVGTALSVSFLSLAAEGATLGSFAVLMTLFTAAAARARTDVRVGSVAVSASLAYATALTVAGGASLGLRAEHTALLVLLVPVAAALLAARLGRHPLTVPAEVTGAVAGVVGIGLALDDAPALALVLALCGVIAAGTAVREDRRAVGYAAGVLFLLASWVRLAAWGTHATEAYTLPVTAFALLVGGVRRRRDPEASSWTAYGAGLAATLLPSLAAAWSDPHWLRPLLLGTAALFITLVGARHRLQAPLVLGGTVLALDTLHELAPYVVQVVDALPRWLPPALAGVLLLAVGATYEQRMRDARRVREVLGRMR